MERIATTCCTRLHTSTIVGMGSGRDAEILPLAQNISPGETPPEPSLKASSCWLQNKLEHECQSPVLAKSENLPISMGSMCQNRDSDLPPNKARENGLSHTTRPAIVSLVGPADRAIARLNSLTLTRSALTNGHVGVSQSSAPLQAGSRGFPFSFLWNHPNRDFEKPPCGLTEK